MRAGEEKLALQYDRITPYPVLLALQRQVFIDIGKGTRKRNYAFLDKNWPALPIAL